MSSRVLGSGGYGTVRLDPTDPTKCIKTLTPPFPERSVITSRQRVLDTIDPPDPKNNKRKYFGGKITDETINSINHITKFKMVLQGESLEKVSITSPTRDKLKKAFLNLLDGLCVLYKHKYSHNDIKKENITYDEKTETLKFIDPDLFLTQFKTTSPSFFYHAYAPELWPSYSRYNDSNITEFNKNMKTGGFFDTNDANNFRQLMRSTDLSSVNLNQPIHWWIQELLEFLRDKSYYNHDYSKTDVYSLGLVAAHLFYESYPELRPIINSMIRPDPSNRCTAEEAREMWKRALKPSTKTVSFGPDIVHEPASVEPVIMQKAHTPPSAAGDIKQPPRGASPRQNPAAVQLLYLAAVSFI